jgi:hypothetical protein
MQPACGTARPRHGRISPVLPAGPLWFDSYAKGIDADNLRVRAVGYAREYRYSTEASVHHAFLWTRPVCYANCDYSTNAPALDVNDFVCFQSKFAAGDGYANCDGSSLAPTLNVADFICFMTKFAGGCS